MEIPLSWRLICFALLDFKVYLLLMLPTWDMMIKSCSKLWFAMFYIETNVNKIFRNQISTKWWVEFCELTIVRWVSVWIITIQKEVRTSWKHVAESLRSAKILEKTRNLHIIAKSLKITRKLHSNFRNVFNICGFLRIVAVVAKYLINFVQAVDISSKSC